MIVSGLPPVGKFPALPQPLRWYLGGRAKLFDRLIFDQLSNDSFGRYLSIDFSDDIMCSTAAVGLSADLTTLSLDMRRVLSLLHFNSIVDKQQFIDPNGQLTKWRHRGFNAEGNVPTVPGGNETAGKIFEHEFEAEYDGANQPKVLIMKKVQ